MNVTSTLEQTFCTLIWRFALCSLPTLSTLALPIRHSLLGRKTVVVSITISFIINYLYSKISISFDLCKFFASFF